MSEFRREAALAVSNAATAGQRLLGEPPNRRGDVEAALGTVAYVRRILHSLAAISDYPTRETIKVESKEVFLSFESLADAFESLAASLEKGEEPPRLRIVSDWVSKLELIFPISRREKQQFPSRVIGQVMLNPTEEWLLYHVKNMLEVTLATREVVRRLVTSERGLVRTAGAAD